MKKFAYVAILALAAGMMVVPVEASSHEDGEKKFSVHGEVRARYEYVENLADLTDKDDSTGQFDDEFGFGAYRARVGVMGKFTKDVAGYIEIQNFGIWGNDWPQKGFQNSLFQSENEIDDSEVDLYQAFIALNEIGGSKFSVKVGRMELKMGNELMIGDNDYYNGQSFDGAVAGYAFESWNLHWGWLTIEEDNFSGNSPDCIDLGGPFSDCDSDNIDLYGVGADFEIGDTDQVIEPYLLYYRNGDAPFGVKTATFGVRYSRDIDFENEKLIDWSIEVAGQSGEIDPNGRDLDQSGFIAEGQLGFNFFHSEENDSRVYVGFLTTGGDDDDTDDDVDNFLSLFPDMHANNRLGNIDLGPHALTGILSAVSDDFIEGDTGITDFNIGYTGHYGNHGVLVAIHMLSATEDENLPNNEDDIGMVIDLGYDYMYSKNLSFGVELSSFDAGDLADEAGFDADDGLRLAGQVRLRW